jgi:hypothetical protein
MNTNPEMDAPDRPTHQDLNKIHAKGPQTIPSLWDVSEMLSQLAPSPNGSRARKNGSMQVVRQKQTLDKNSRLLSELPELDSLGFFFKPY